MYQFVKKNRFWSLGSVEPHFAQSFIRSFIRTKLPSHRTESQITESLQHRTVELIANKIKTISVIKCEVLIL